MNDTMPEIRNWVPGEAIIREHSVTADVNKKAERRVNKKTAVMTGERYNKEMEVTKVSLSLALILQSIN